MEPAKNIVGISSAVIGTIQIALITLVISFPLAVMIALYVSEYAPLRLRSFLISVIDLMAAVPSIVYGVWGVFLLQPHALFLSRVAVGVVRLDPDLQGHTRRPARRGLRRNTAIHSRRSWLVWSSR